MPKLTLSDIRKVNREINSNVCYKSDAQLYNTPEFWTVAINAGDCEDYALAKRKALLEMGADIADLRLATAWTDGNVYHAVLIAKTDEGEYVLDNRYAFPIMRQDLNYKWHLIQEGAQWCEIQS